MANSDSQLATISKPIGSGTILSQDFRNSVIGGEVSNSPISTNNLSLIQNRQRQLDLDSSVAIGDQQQAFISFSSGIQSLRADIGKLNSGLNSIALLLQQDAESEQNRILTEQEKERRLTEQEIRIGKENEIEQKIQNAVTEPAQKMVPEVENLFGGVGRALSYLFGGWLAVETVKSIQNAGQQNIKIFGDIKFDILKKIGIVAGGLFAISAGFTMVKRTMGSIVNGLWKLFIPKPRLGGGGVGGIIPGVGKFVAFLSGYLNFKNKEYTDSILSMMSLASMVPGPIGAIGKIAGIAFTADEIAEAFGKNIFGDERDKVVNEIAQKFIGKTDGAAKPAEPSAPKPPETPTPATPKPPQTPTPAVPKPPAVAPVTPTVPSLPAAPQAPPAASQAAPQQTMTGQTMMPSEPQTPLTPERIQQLEQAWQYRNFSPVRGKIEDAWNKATPEQKQQAKDWAKSKGYDWSEMRLPDSTVTPTNIIPPISNIQTQVAGVSTSNVPQVMSSVQSPPTEITSQPQITNIPKEPQQVGQLPEPNPKITMIAPFSQSNTPQAPPITDGPLTDVPLIGSANPDNFYVLYSQLCYNVVT